MTPKLPNIFSISFSNDDGLVVNVTQRKPNPRDKDQNPLLIEFIDEYEHIEGSMTLAFNVFSEVAVAARQIMEYLCAVDDDDPEQEEADLQAMTKKLYELEPGIEL